MSKRETIEEFLARGGVIQKIPAQELPEEESKVTSSSNGTSHMMSLADGSVYYAETKAKKVSKKKLSKTIDFSALPAHLLRFVPNHENN